MIDTIIQIVALIAAVIMLLRADSAIKNMGRQTRTVVRMIFVSMAGTAAFQISEILFHDHVPTVFELVFMIGLVLLFFFDSRLTAFIKNEYRTTPRRLRN